MGMQSTDHATNGRTASRVVAFVAMVIPRPDRGR
jgi:hypothetical protein